MSEDTSQPPAFVPGKLLKTARVVGGDDEFAMRVEAACWMHGIPFTPEVLRAVAADETVQAGVTVDEHMTVSSRGVDDATIEAAVQATMTSPPAESA